MVSTVAMLLISDSLSLAENGIVSAEGEGRSVEDLETGLKIFYKADVRICQFFFDVEALSCSWAFLVFIKPVFFIFNLCLISSCVHLALL